MKILCVSDHVDPLVYSQKIKDRFRDVDIVLGAGDLPLRYYGYIVSCLNKPLYFIFGNHNLKKMYLFKKSEANTDFYEPSFRHTFGSVSLEDKVVRIKEHDLIIAGLGGCRLYNNGPHQYTEFQMFLRIMKIVPKLLFYKIVRGRFLDILLTHTPPYMIHDQDDPCHCGFKVFKLFLKWFRPKYLIHGHIHLYDNRAKRVTFYRHTCIINTYDHYLLNTEENDGKSSYFSTSC